MVMKKYIALFAAAAALLAGCKDYNYEAWIPDETFSRTGEVSFLATFENLQTKAFMDEKGHGTWDRGDQIAVACTDGTLVTFNLDGTGDTKRAIFKGTIPAGKELGSVAVYPASSAASCDGQSITLKVPGSYKASVSSAYTGVMVAAIGDDWNLPFKQALGFLKLTINNYPADANRILLSSPDGALSGTFKCPIADVLDSGIKPAYAIEKGDAELLVSAAGKSVYAFLPVPAADYSVINASFRDAKGREVIGQTLSDYSTGVSRAELHEMIVACGEIAAPPCRINIGGERSVLDEVSPNVFEGEFEIPASGSFTVEFDGELRLRYILRSRRPGHNYLRGICTSSCQDQGGRQEHPQLLRQEGHRNLGQHCCCQQSLHPQSGKRRQDARPLRQFRSCRAEIQHLPGRAA